MKIAQIVIVKTKRGNWKLMIMSRQRTEEVIIHETTSHAWEELGLRMTAGEWDDQLQ